MKKLTGKRKLIALMSGTALVCMLGLGLLYHTEIIPSQSRGSLLNPRPYTKPKCGHCGQEISPNGSGHRPTCPYVNKGKSFF